MSQHRGFDKQEKREIADSDRLAPSFLDDDKLYRLSQIVRDPKRPEFVPLIPICAASWWRGIRHGIYPKGKKLSPRVTVWRGYDLRKVSLGTWKSLNE